MNAIKNKNYQEISKLQDIGTARDIDNRNFAERVHAMNGELASNNDRLEHFSEVKEQKDIDL